MSKGKFTRVRYIWISRISLEVVNNLTEHEKALFLDQCLTWYLDLEQGKDIDVVETENKMLDFALREELPELQAGFEQYMRKATGTKKSTETNITPMEGHSLPNGISMPTLSEQNRQDKNNKQIIDQIKSKLLPAGYSSDDVDRVCCSVQDWSVIQNPTGYVRKSIDNQRNRPQKKVLAQDFKQRDYSSVEAEMMADLAQEMKEYKAEQNMKAEG